MQVIPAINCNNFNCVKRRIKKVAEFLPKNSWIQIDVSDGKFAPVKTWNEPEKLFRWLQKTKITKFNVEVHLMVKDYECEANRWLENGARRVIVHVETIDNPKFKSSWLDRQILKLKEKNQIGVALNPKTSIKELASFLKKFNFVQILAVEPGYSGQEFDGNVLKKIKFLKKNYPRITVEVDGGINDETIKAIKAAGADIVVSGSFLFNSKNFRKRYIKLF